MDAWSALSAAGVVLVLERVCEPGAGVWLGGWMDVQEWLGFDLGLVF
jgi:ribulose 1,5-bisphosphate synthetase/thiazole synthase